MRHLMVGSVGVAVQQQSMDWHYATRNICCQSMDARSGVEARIMAFLRDSAEASARYSATDGTTLESRMQLVTEELAKLRERHCLVDQQHGSVVYGIGSPPDHDPESERILAIELKGRQEAVVRTENARQLRMFYEYNLQKTGNEWRITRIDSYFADEEEESNDPSLTEIQKASPKLEPTNAVPEGLERLFEGPAKLKTTAHGVVHTQVERVGTIRAPSGFLVCDDPGNWANGAAVLTAHVPSGEHVIELVKDDVLKVVGAARLVFYPGNQGVGYAKALRRGGDFEESDLIAVDGGLIGLVDAGALLVLKKRERERFYHQLAEASTAPGGRGATFVRINDSLEAVAIVSGCGVGAYEAFWELDAAGKPLALVFDFAEFGDEVWKKERVQMRMSKGKGIAKFGDWGMEVRFEKDQQEIQATVPTRQTHRLSLLAGDELLFSSQGAGCYICGDETTYSLPSEFPENFEGSAQLELYLGHQYHFL